MRQTQRDGGNRSFAFGKLGINLARNRNILVSFFEIPAANIGHIRNGWTDAERSAPTRLGPISASSKFDFGRTECVVDTEAQLYALLAPFGDSQFLSGRAENRQ